MTASDAALPLNLLERLCTAAEMRRMDEHAVRTLGLPSRLLMENAAHEVAARLQAVLREGAAHSRKKDKTRKPVAVCCGSGNNGGDGYAAARLLRNAGIPCIVVRCGEPSTPDAQDNAAAWAHFGKTLDWTADEAACRKLLTQAPGIVDALFGTGLSRTLEGPVRTLIEAINAAPAPAKIAVDIPSGIHADTGAVLGDAVQATHTVCFQVPKIGSLQHPGAGYGGELSVVPVSIKPGWPAGTVTTYRLTGEFAQAIRPKRSKSANKGTYGHLFAICGSSGMGGAARLCGLSAGKIGTGKVTLAVPSSLQDKFLQGAPELMTFSPDEGADAKHFILKDGKVLAKEAGKGDAVVLGCGLGRSDETNEFVADLVPRLKGAPLLIDADGLFALKAEMLAGRKKPAVLTPHPGELSHMTGISIEELQRDRVGHARRLAAQWKIVLVLKGAGTVIASPEGPVFVNPTGDDGLATAGTGDVLSGVIGGLMAQGLDPLSAALLGVYVHGYARDINRGVLTRSTFMAMDLVRSLNKALKSLED